MKAPQDPFQGEEWDTYVRAVIDGPEALTQMIYTSAVGISLVPEDVAEVDVKFAIELGFMIMFDKPIIAIVLPGSHVPDKLRLVADQIIEADLNTERGSAKVTAALKKALNEMKEGDSDGD
jgi:hypothetical protein